MTPNGVKVLRALGLWQSLSDVSFLPHSIVGRDWKTANINFRTPLKDECPRLYGAEFFHVHRADLHRILTTLVDPTTVQCSTSCVSVNSLISRPGRFVSCRRLLVEVAQFVVDSRAKA